METAQVVANDQRRSAPRLEFVDGTVQQRALARARLSTKDDRHRPVARPHPCEDLGNDASLEQALVVFLAEPIALSIARRARHAFGRRAW